MDQRDRLEAPAPPDIDAVMTNHTDGAIFYRAIMNLNGEPEDAFGALVVDGRIWR